SCRDESERGIRHGLAFDDHRPSGCDLADHAAGRRVHGHCCRHGGEELAGLERFQEQRELRPSQCDCGTILLAKHGRTLRKLDVTRFTARLREIASSCDLKRGTQAASMRQESLQDKTGRVATRRTFWAKMATMFRESETKKIKSPFPGMDPFI